MISYYMVRKIGNFGADLLGFEGFFPIVYHARHIDISKE